MLKLLAPRKVHVYAGSHNPLEEMKTVLPCLYFVNKRLGKFSQLDLCETKKPHFVYKFKKGIGKSILFYTFKKYINFLLRHLFLSALLAVTLEDKILNNF